MLKLMVAILICIDKEPRYSSTDMLEYALRNLKGHEYTGSRLFFLITLAWMKFDGLLIFAKRRDRTPGNRHRGESHSMILPRGEQFLHSADAAEAMKEAC